MRDAARRTLAGLSGIALALGLLGAAERVSAEPRSQRVETEAEWISYDAEAKTVTVKVTKPGRGPAAEGLQKYKEATFKVKPTGSVLERTVVKINGMKAELGDVPKGKTVKLYWVPDPADPAVRFAMLIDTTLSEEEFEERYGAE
jgi:hypothetical protein